MTDIYQAFRHKQNLDDLCCRATVEEAYGDAYDLWTLGHDDVCVCQREAPGRVCVPRPPATADQMTALAEEDLLYVAYLTEGR